MEKDWNIAFCLGPLKSGRNIVVDVVLAGWLQGGVPQCQLHFLWSCGTPSCQWLPIRVNVSISRLIF